MHSASERDDVVELGSVLERRCFDVDSKDEHGSTALHIAAARGNFNACRLLHQASRTARTRQRSTLHRVGVLQASTRASAAHSTESVCGKPAHAPAQALSPRNLSSRLHRRITPADNSARPPPAFAAAVRFVPPTQSPPRRRRPLPSPPPRRRPMTPRRRRRRAARGPDGGARLRGADAGPGGAGRGVRGAGGLAG